MQSNKSQVLVGRRIRLQATNENKHTEITLLYLLWAMRFA